MKKRYQVLSLCTMIAAANLFMPSDGVTADIATSAAGKEITITATAAGLTDMKFQPSPQVVMKGITAKSAFSIAAVNDSVLGKENGEAYAMTSEASGLFFYKAPPLGYAPAVGAAGLLTGDYKLPDGTTHTAPAAPAAPAEPAAGG